MEHDDRLLTMEWQADAHTMVSCVSYKSDRCGNGDVKAWSMICSLHFCTSSEA